MSKMENLCIKLKKTCQRWQAKFDNRTLLCILQVIIVYKIFLKYQLQYCLQDIIMPHADGSSGSCDGHEQNTYSILNSYNFV